jgi:hypothetical protein
MNLYHLVKAVYKENTIRRMLRRREDNVEVSKWLAGTKHGLTPQALKRQMIRKIARDNPLSAFVETGTCYGHTVSSCIGLFERIYSIEFDRKLYEHCLERFRLQHSVNALSW